MLIAGVADSCRSPPSCSSSSQGCQHQQQKNALARWGAGRHLQLSRVRSPHQTCSCPLLASGSVVQLGAWRGRASPMAARSADAPSCTSTSLASLQPAPPPICPHAQRHTQVPRQLPHERGVPPAQSVHACSDWAPDGVLAPVQELRQVRHHLWPAQSWWSAPTARVQVCLVNCKQRAGALLSTCERVGMLFHRYLNALSLSGSTGLSEHALGAPFGTLTCT